MELGAFSLSLAVKDLAASRAFYEKLGFEAFGGDPSENWLILKNGDVVIGLFQGMFEKNMLTFSPGWDSNAQTLESFTDVREIQRRLKEQGVTFETEADENTTGPAHFIIVDPDGNPILFDTVRLSHRGSDSGALWALSRQGPPAFLYLQPPAHLTSPKLVSWPIPFRPADRFASPCPLLPCSCQPERGEPNERNRPANL